MQFASHLGDIRLAHVACAALSVSLFACRGVLRIAGSALANHRALRIVSQAIDTALLAAAVMLSGIIGQYPFLNGWLTAKVLLLVAYIALGTMALRRARTRWGRIAALAAALLTFAAIVGVAVTHHPAGWLTLLVR